MNRYFAVCLLTLVACHPDLIAASPNNPPSPKPQELYEAYWTAEPGWHTDIQIRNNYAAQNLDVQVVLRTSNGAEIPLPPVTIAPDDSQVFDVGNALSAAAPQLQPTGAYGSAVFRFTSNGPGNIFANVMVHRDGEPIGFHFDAYTVDPALQSEESVWWLSRDSTQAFVVVANVSKVMANATVRISAPDGTPVAVPVLLGPGEMRRLSLREIAPELTAKAGFGGVSVAMSPPGTVTANVLEYDDAIGLSASFTVFDRIPATAAAETTTLRSPMVALTQPAPELGLPTSVTLKPQVFVRNATANPLSVLRSVNWKSATQSGSASYAAVVLGPGETRLFAIAPDNQIPANANWATVALTYNGPYGDLVAAATSESADGTYGLQSPFSPNLAPR